MSKYSTSQNFYTMLSIIIINIIIIVIIIKVIIVVQYHIDIPRMEYLLHSTTN